MRGEGAYFIPDQKAARSTEPLDFTWLPNLHKAHDHLCSDHFFRSPVVCVVGNGFYAALVPDLDLRVIDGLVMEAPRLSYGICPTVFDGHVVTDRKFKLSCTSIYYTLFFQKSSTTLCKT